MTRLADPSVAKAVRLFYEASKEQQDAAQDALDSASRVHEAASRLHDLLLHDEEQVACEGRLRVLPGGQAG